MILSSSFNCKFQINWLSYQIFGISKQALDFVRDGKNRIPDESVAKIFIFDNTPS